MKDDYMYVASATSKGCGLNSPKPAPLLFHHIVSIQYFAVFNNNKKGIIKINISSTN